MTLRQLRTNLTAWLKEAEPLDRPSDFTPEECEAIATKAAKKLSLLGYGGGQLLTRAYQVEDARQCAAILAECLVLLPQDEKAVAASNGALSVPEVAAILGVSKETVYKRAKEGDIPCTRIGTRVTFTHQQLAEYQEQASY